MCTSTCADIAGLVPWEAYAARSDRNCSSKSLTTVWMLVGAFPFSPLRQFSHSPARPKGERSFMAMT